MGGESVSIERLLAASYIEVISDLQSLFVTAAGITIIKGISAGQRTLRSGSCC